MKFNRLLLFFASLIIGFPCASAAIASADFRAEFDWPGSGSGARIFQTVNRAVNLGTELGAWNEIANPSSYRGSAQINLNPNGDLFLTGDHELGTIADYQRADFQINNIVLSGGKAIVGVQTIYDTIIDTTSLRTDGPTQTTISFTSNAVSITYNPVFVGHSFEFGDGFGSKFQLVLATVPEPSSMTFLLGLSSATVCAMRRRRRVGPHSAVNPGD